MHDHEMLPSAGTRKLGGKLQKQCPTCLLFFFLRSGGYATHYKKCGRGGRASMRSPRLASLPDLQTIAAAPPRPTPTTKEDPPAIPLLREIRDLLRQLVALWSPQAPPQDGL